MPIEILMPALSPTMTEGTLARWTKKEGDRVKAGDVIAEIETDKATMEVEAVEEGTLGRILVKDGTENVPVNQPIALLLEEGEDKKTLASWKPKEQPQKTTPPDQETEPTPAKANTPASAPSVAALAAYQPTKAPELPKGVAAGPAGQGIKASPLARKLAAAKGVDLARVHGTGPKGRIVQADIEDFLKRGGTSGLVRRAAMPFSKLPNSGMRKTVAKRLLEAKQTMPHFYLTVECEIDKLLDVRAQLNDAAPQGEDGKPLYKISVNDMVIKASALAMKKKPEVNASWYDDAIVVYGDIDISVAVSIDGGLITPIVRNADQKTLAQISGEMKALAAKARAGKLQPEEYHGGGFSVSNLGMYGVKHFAAIINPPQAAILAVGAGESKLVLRNGAPAEVTVMNVTLSVDHRAVDGALGAEWLQEFKRYIESPALLVA